MDGTRSVTSLTLVIPAFNEAEGIALALMEADEVLSGRFADYEILVVDDGSGDGTAHEVEQVCLLRPRVRSIRLPANIGYGAALRAGFSQARYGLIAFTDADRQFDLRDLSRLCLATRGAPIAVGYRVGRQDTLRRRVLSRGYNLLARAWLGTRVRDCDCALKVFRREALVALLPTSDGFFVNTEMLARANRLGYAVVELPVSHRPRLRGVSKVSLWEVPRTLAQMFRFWWTQTRQTKPTAASGDRILDARVSVPPSPRRSAGRRFSSAADSRVAPPAPLRESA